jgi:tRNA dimethylallyltransferase
MDSPLNAENDKMIMNNLIAIVGPTGVGKTRLAIQLAQKFNGEIVNADSRQVYRFMDIGTAKPTKEEQPLVLHHLIDIINPDDDFSLAIYQRRAYTAILDIQNRGKLPFLVGGTGQYIWAVLEGWTIPKVSPDIEYRKSLEQKASEDASSLYHELQIHDPVAAEKIDPRNVRRVIRALEVTRNKPFSQSIGKNPLPFEYSIIGLTMPRKDLYQRVDARVDEMLKQGFIDEVKKLIEMGFSLELPSMSSIGYREIGLYLQNRMTLDEAVYKIKTGTHRLIRHQYAWFKLSDNRIKWFNTSSFKESAVEELVRSD